MCLLRVWTTGILSSRADIVCTTISKDKKKGRKVELKSIERILLRISKSPFNFDGEKLIKF